MKNDFIISKAYSLPSGLEKLRKLANEGDWIFRGQREAAWKLVSSIARYASQFDLRVDRAYYDEYLTRYRKLRLDHFSLGWDDSPEELKSKIKIEVDAQHHGLPTRLLDWSYSPFIALFFAFDGVGRSDLKVESGQVAVWCLNRDLFFSHIARELKMGSESGSDLQELRRRMYKLPVYADIVEDEIPNRRIRMQKGLFTILNSSQRSLDEFLKLEGFPRGTLLKVRIAKAHQVDALKSLNHYGISSDRIYPDIEGVVSQVFNQSFRARL